ncbi:MAG: gamma-glutamyltransferase family protein, partial [Actinomycetota bacterium]|nr:gamma-glutamyltransferase family protein [Actinomycetota bacterium]
SLRRIAAAATDGFYRARPRARLPVSGAVEPGRRPYHTIISGLLLRDGAGGRLEPRRRLAPLDLAVVRTDEASDFGGGQAILVHDDVPLGGSDGRRTGTPCRAR